jgi:hypothetical protein
MSNSRSQPGPSALAAVAELRRMPAGSLLGVVVMALGLAADVVAHLDPAVGDHHGVVTNEQLSAHLVAFAGMVLVLAGVVVDGIRSTLRR